MLFKIFQILGFTNPYSISYYKNKVQSSIKIDNYEYNSFYYIYSLIIFTILLIQPFYIIYNNNTSNLGFLIYKAIYPIHFILLYWKFYKIIEYKYLEDQLFYNALYFSQIIIFILIFINICISYSNPYLINIQAHTHIFFNIADVFGIFTYLNSLIIFIYIFLKITKNIYIINDKIAINISQNKKKGLITLFYNIIDLKHDVNKAIENFHFIFNTFTLYNLFALGFIIKSFNILNSNQKIFLYINITVFVLIEIICLSIILYISKLKADLFQKIYNPLFVNNFIKKYDINTFNDRFNQEVSISDVELGNNFIINILEENSTSIDWIILNLTLYSKWMDFDFFGIKIQSINSITQIAFIISIIYKLFNIQTL